MNKQQVQEEVIESELEMLPSVDIPDGSHKGTIVGVEVRTLPYAYHDIIIQPDEYPKSLTLKVGYSSYLSEKSKLGQLLKRFNCQPKIGEKLLISKALIGKRCIFLTMKEAGKGGEFIRIIPDTLKPE